MSVAFNEMCKKKDPSVYVKFGIEDIDNIVGTISPGNIVTIASKTGIGKSSLSLYPALRSSRTKNVMFVSTEMSRNEMMERCIAHISTVPMDAIKEGRTTPFQMDLLSKALSQDVPNMQVTFIDSINTVTEMIQQVETFKREGKPVRVLVVDHIGHVKPGGGYRPVSEYADIKESCKMLKNLALKNGIVVFMISQLNRMISNDQKPNLNHLKDCGEIEQISDKVLFMWRDSEDKSIIHFECGKNRSGESGGECTKRFYGSTMRYENV
jgi:replicative DNA helicase